MTSTTTTYRRLFPWLVLALLGPGCSTSPPASDESIADESPRGESIMPGLADADWADGDRIEVRLLLTSQKLFYIRDYEDSDESSTRECTVEFELAVEGTTIAFTSNADTLFTRTTDPDEFAVNRQHRSCAVPSFVIDGDGHIVSTEAAELSALVTSKIEHFLEANDVDERHTFQSVSEPQVLKRAEQWRDILIGAIETDGVEEERTRELSCTDDPDAEADCIEYSFQINEDLSHVMQNALVEGEALEQAWKREEYVLRLRPGSLPPVHVLFTFSGAILTVDAHGEPTTHTSGTTVHDFTIRHIR